MHLKTRIKDAVVGLWGSIQFTRRLIHKWIKCGRFKYPYKNSGINQSIYVLANGPSLNEEIVELRQQGTLFKEPLFVVNFFGLSPSFSELKPSRYCLADSGFFIDRLRVDETSHLIGILNKEVTWSMNLYVQDACYSIAKKKIINENIRVVPISTLHYSGFECIRSYFYRKGWSTPSFVNVLMMVEYVCLNEGFKTIYLYGADHTFLNNLIVGDDNVLYVNDEHFYGKEKTIADIHPNGKPWRVAEFIYDKYLTFIEHDVMRRYADYLGAKIINCTKGSLIDSYVRLAQLERNE